MPNHYSNHIKFIGNDTDIAEIMALVKSEERDFDFNKIIPMPEELDIEASSYGNDGMYYLLYKANCPIPESRKYIIESFEQLEDKEKEDRLTLGRKYLANIAKYGYPTWYEWRYEHWGTKWNAYDIEVKDNEFYLVTANGSSFPILERISTLYPNIKIEYSIYDRQNLQDYAGAIQAGEELWYEHHDYYPYDEDDQDEDEDYQEISTSEANTTGKQSAPQELMDDGLPF